ncbi:chitin disaccharide deacetylase [Paenactinomyces guangxiensis]|uniref:Carbohydrate deacetylase n=1 Tax=Paenactinomyces guangxiensis TaxID=1490290 RepID=A0A7W1WPW7_9BACL|nr:chitin disaccharide deacetylase [Paenactinomyces guangxiensis]MBA4493896.1 chitin disaccharide deacetylase [Paenactinomyces guangxiensis]MBH8591362.1 chitin disaccharide deacetylase [Paenactinomyces guangxiensis]
MKLIVNADDFGYSRAVNFGIIDAYKYGIVTSATLLVNMPGASHAFELAKEHPGLGVGIHLTLTCGSPLSDHVPSLVNDQGEFHKKEDLFSYAQVSDIEREFTCQMERFFSSGITPTHIDSHHHVHFHNAVLPIVLRLAERYQLPVRNFTTSPVHKENRKLVKTTDLFLSGFYGDHVTVEWFEKMLDTVEEAETAEIMCHPAYLDAGVLTGSSYHLPRTKELAVLTDPRTKELIRERNMELITFREIE